MRSIFIQFILIFVFVQPVGFVSIAWSEGLPSQTERFKGMGSTFKAKKVQAKSNEATAENKQENEEEEESNINKTDDKISSYFKLHTFVVNVTENHSYEKILFLTVDIYCEIKNPEDKALIDSHIAPIKDSIITYLSGINRKDIQTPRQKKALQAKLTERVSDVLLKLTGKKVINGLYVTRMIIK